MDGDGGQVRGRMGRLFVSIGYALRTPEAARTPAQPQVRAGVDLGMRMLATVATIDTATGTEPLSNMRIRPHL